MTGELVIYDRKKEQTDERARLVVGGLRDIQGGFIGRAMNVLHGWFVCCQKKMPVFVLISSLPAEIAQYSVFLAVIQS